jgi:chromosome segregation protein
MQLSKLEIKGFKSFGDKVVINFDEGITGIVGPNGCGKSNIVDAIRWVLGEQKTKALRSEKMENIIFNGTKTRKALQMAEVSLTFNNNRKLLPTEYSQVTITRKYYRSGESEYLLNNVTCRLKDITNLFLDTGIGSDSYAIIELKMVDDILNDKDNSRRGLFEEAAGISKFKVRKKETLRKLEETDTDLARVEDLLHEISKNLKVLEKQAKQTQSYFKLKEEYKHWSIVLARKTIDKHSESFLKLGKQIEAEQERKRTLQQQLGEKELSLEKEKGSLIEKERLFAARQRTLNEYVGRIRQFENEKKIRQERQTFLTDKLTSLRIQLEQDQGNIRKAEDEIAKLTRQKLAAELVVRETSERLAFLQEEYQAQKNLTHQLQQEVSQASQQFRKHQEEVYQLKKSLEIKQIQLSSLKQELERAASANAEQSTNLHLFEDKLYEITTRLEEGQQSLNSLQSSVKEIQEETTGLEADIEQLKQEMGQHNRTLDAKQNEYKLTKSLVESLEGFPEAIKFLKKHHAFDKNALLVSDILTCPNEYRVAIENYLEPVMNYYVVQTEEQAYQAIGWLSHAEKGRANFFVLDNVGTYASVNALKSDAEKGIIAAIDIVEYDPKYQYLVHILLDNVYILTQNQPVLPRNDGAIFITQNGKTTRRRFSISGGSVGLFEGKRIGRARNLENLKTETAQLNQTLAGLNTSLHQNQQQKQELQTKLTSLSAAVGQKQKEITLISQEQITVRTRQEQTMQLLQSQSERHSAIQEQMEILQEEIEEHQPEAENKAAALKEIEARVSQLNEELLYENEALGQKSSAYNQENIAVHQQQNKVSALVQEIHFQEQALQSSLLRLTKNKEELNKTDQLVHQLADTTEADDDTLDTLQQEKRKCRAGCK